MVCERGLMISAGYVFVVLLCVFLMGCEVSVLALFDLRQDCIYVISESIIIIRLKHIFN